MPHPDRRRCRWILCIVVAGLACRPSGEQGPAASPPRRSDARALPRADYQREIGTEHPVMLIASAASARWVVACQARTDSDGSGTIEVRDGSGTREGDALLPYLFRGGGAGQVFDELVAVSSDERWLVLLRAGELVLVDDLEGVERTLTRAVPRAWQRGAHRIAAIDGSSRYLVYAGMTGRMIIRDLVRQQEREIVVPDAELSRIAAEPIGSWLRLVFASRGADAFQAYEGPSAPVPEVPGPICADLTTRAWIFGIEAPQAWLNAETGEVRRDPEVLARLGELEIARRRDQAIRIGTDDVVPASCAAEVIAVSVRPLRILVACTATPDGRMEMFGPSLHVTLAGSRRTPSNRGPVELSSTPYVCPTPRACFAWQDGAPVAVPGLARSTAETNVLSEDRFGHQITDAVTGVTRRLPGVTGNIHARAMNIVAIDSMVVDLAQGSVLGDLPRVPLAIDASGRGLVPSARSSFGFARGPLRWVLPHRGSTSDGAVNAGSGEPPHVITGIARDEHGNPLQGVKVTVDDQAPMFGDDGVRSRPYPSWLHPDVVGVPGSGAASSQYVLPDRTDRTGSFAWDPRGAGLHAVMLVADDGRVAAADAIRPGPAKLELRLRPPGALRIVCKGFGPEDLQGSVEVGIGVRTLRTECDKVVGGLPAGAYTVLAEIDEHRYAVRDVVVHPGRTTRAVLTVPSAGIIRGTVVEYPGDRPLAGVSCTARAALGDTYISSGPSGESQADGSFEIEVSGSRFQVRCASAPELAAGAATVELAEHANVVVRMVRYRDDAVDVGVTLDAEPQGARVRSVARRAARAGLLPGDLVLAADDVSLAGLSRASMARLAFEAPPEKTLRWTVVRERRLLTITVPPW
jgi:hypothetical protein